MSDLVVLAVKVKPSLKKKFDKMAESEISRIPRYTKGKFFEDIFTSWEKMKKEGKSK